MKAGTVAVIAGRTRARARSSTCSWARRSPSSPPSRRPRATAFWAFKRSGCTGRVCGYARHLQGGHRALGAHAAHGGEHRQGRGADLIRARRAQGRLRRGHRPDEALPNHRRAYARRLHKDGHHARREHSAGRGKRCTRWGIACDVYPVSARKGRGIEKLRRAIVAALPEGEPLFPEDVVSDKSERFMLGEIMREKIF